MQGNLKGGEWAEMTDFSTNYVSKDVVQNYLFYPIYERRNSAIRAQCLCYKGLLMHSIHFIECSLLI